MSGERLLASAGENPGDSMGNIGILPVELLQALRTNLNWADKAILCSGWVSRKGFKCICGPVANALSRGCEVTLITAKVTDAKKTVSIINKTGSQTSVVKMLKECGGNRADMERIKVVFSLGRPVKSDRGRLHSKVYLFEKEQSYRAVVGSANLTGSGLLHNREFCVQISGSVEDEMHRQLSLHIDSCKSAEERL